ncbi:MAG: type II secretion system F family protein [Holosporales bacterium]
MIEVLLNNLVLLLFLTAQFTVTLLFLIHTRDWTKRRKSRIQKTASLAADPRAFDFILPLKPKPSFDRLGRLKDSAERWYDRYTVLLLRAGLQDHFTLLPLIFFVALVAFLLMGELFSAWLGSYLMVYAPVIALGVIALVVRFALDKRADQITALLPSALEAFSRVLHAGGTPERGLATLAEDAEKPLNQVFGDMVRLIQVGVPFEEALRSTAHKLDHRDFSFFAATLIIQRQSGGAIIETIDHVIEVLHRRKELRLKMKSLMADAMVSSIILTLVPVALFSYVVFVSDTYRSFYFDTDLGKKIIFYTVIFLLVGNFIIRRMARLKV